jgi:hypothetical protein
MFTTVSSYFSAAGPRLALPLGLLLAGPAAHAQAPDSTLTPALNPAPAALADLQVFPNPAHIRATVQVPAVPATTRAVVTLSDAQGTVVFEQPVSLTEAGGKAEVPLLGRTPGLYRVLVQAGDQRAVRTLKVE